MSLRIARIAATTVLLLFVGATVGLLIAQEMAHLAPAEDLTGDGTTIPSASQEQPSVPSTDGAPPVAEASEDAAHEPDTVCVVDAVYFHNTARCYTCRTIEATAKSVLEVAFPDELSDGRLRWSAVNMEQQRGYVERYDLVKPTLILVRSADGEEQEWTALDETWTLIRYSERFSTYVEENTAEFLSRCR